MVIVLIIIIVLLFLLIQNRPRDSFGVRRYQVVDKTDIYNSGATLRAVAQIPTDTSQI